MLKTLDGTFAQQAPNSYLYKINTRIAAESGAFHDVNAHFDHLGLPLTYRTQREWIKEGGIKPAAIIQYMTGQRFMDQYNHHRNEAPDEQALAGWSPLSAFRR
nr:hypothetical protein [Xenorhabdus kozodoii]